MIFSERNVLYDNIISIAISPYKLKAKAVLNAKIKNSQVREGFLLKVSFKDLGIGYADCFVFEELSDLSLTKQLECLRAKKLTDNLRKSLYFAKVDAKFRKNYLNIFHNILLPKNHWTVSDYSFLTEKNLLALKNKAFNIIKVKFGKNLKNDIEFIQNNYFLCKELNFKLRLDFNSALSYAETLLFFDRIKNYLDVIDFIEDPCEFNSNNWSSLIKNFQPIKLALDHRSISHLDNLNDLKDTYFHYLIIKPALQSMQQHKLSTYRSKLDKVIFTSYMDHPFGQLCALYEAALFYQKNPEYEEYSGFLTHFLYDENAFSERLALNKTQLIPPLKGSGFGFDDLLEKENWRKICEY